MTCTPLLAAEADIPLPFPPTAPSLQNTFGAFLICTFLGFLIYGITSHQAYRYFRLYPSDRKTLKIFVLFLGLLDTVHTITNAHACYHYLITNYFNPCKLAEGVWSIRLGIIEGGIVILVSHCFYARRLYLLGGNTSVPIIIIGVLLVAEIGFSIAATTETFVQVEFVRFIPFMWLIWGVLLAAVLVDLVSTSILIYYLRNNRTGFKKTDSMIDVLIVYGINTGLSISILSLTAFICSITSRDTLIWAAITVVATKMYVNSLLAVLNSRQAILEQGLNGFDSGSFGMKVVTPCNGTTHAVELAQEHSRSLQIAPGQPSLTVMVTKEIISDGPSVVPEFFSASDTVLQTSP